VFLLVEELLDSQSIDGCRIVFDFLESRREVLIAVLAQTNRPFSKALLIQDGQNGSKNKDLVILRSCNELLRRLSRAEDAVFCGRVYIFLFQSFPLGDKSSVNLRGEFHVENVTTYEESVQATQNAQDRMDVDSAKLEQDAAKAVESGPSPKNDPKTLSIDSLYPIFWSLQHAFSNPINLFSEDRFADFRKGLEATLAKFKEVPKVIQTTNAESSRGAKRKLDETYDEFASTFNPKYLTSRDLFKLEVRTLPSVVVTCR
jgi:THO complex subunit 1